MDELKTSVTCYGNGIYAIDQEMVRAFLVVGQDKALLLDTGAVRIDIKSYIKSITNLPVTVILTHGDGDHIGNLQDFDEAYCNENDHRAVLSHEHCRNVRLTTLNDGETFDIGGRKLKVISTPGHTAGSICLLDENNKILFSGDTISYGPIFMFGKRRNLPDFLGSLMRLKKMQTDGVFNTVYCCHNVCPITADALDELIPCIKGILDKSIKCTHAPMPVPNGEKPLLCKFGKCMVLISDPEQNKKG